MSGTRLPSENNYQPPSSLAVVDSRNRKFLFGDSPQFHEKEPQTIPCTSTVSVNDSRSTFIRLHILVLINVKTVVLTLV